MNFEIVTGVNEGYFHQNEVKNAEEMVIKIWLKIAKEVYEDTDCYISAIVTPCKVIYNTDWGCPSTVEDLVSLKGTYNSNFLKKDDWIKNVRTLAKMLKEELKQSTMTLEFTESTLDYMEE